MPKNIFYMDGMNAIYSTEIPYYPLSVAYYIRPNGRIFVSFRYVGDTEYRTVSVPTENLTKAILYMEKKCFKGRI